MGVTALGRCHASQADASAFYCAAAFPQTSGLSVVSCSASSGASLSLAITTVPATCSGACTGTSGTLSVTPAWQSCDETAWLQYYPLSMSASDGALIAAAIVGLWLVAAVWNYVRLPLSDRGDGS